MKRITLCLLVALFTLVVQAQEVKIKKKIVYVDGVAEVSMTGCSIQTAGSTCLAKSSKTNEYLFSMRLLYHDGYYNIDLTFVDYDIEMRVKVISYKKMFQQMYELKVIDETGKVNEANAEKYAKLFNTNKPKKIIITE